MAASAKDKAAKDKAAKTAAKEKAAKAKEREKAAKAKEKAAAAKAKEREKAAKAKERAAAAKAKEKAAKVKAKEKAAKLKEREKAAKAKEREKAAKAKERENAKPAAKAKPAARARPATPAPEPVQPVEEVAVPEQGDAEPVPAEVREQPAEAALPALDVPANDKTVRPKGYLAEALGKEDAVGRETQRATLAASYTTRDHDLIRAWAETRGGRPADVAGTGGRRRGAGTAGVLRIEFPDGPGDDSRLEDIDWAPFFSTFDESDVDFLYQERVRTGDVSRFHKIVRASA